MPLWAEMEKSLCQTILFLLGGNLIIITLHYVKIINFFQSEFPRKYIFKRMMIEIFALEDEDRDEWLSIAA